MLFKIHLLFVISIGRFRLQVRVRDETGTVSVALFNEEVQAMVDNMTAYQLVEKYGRVNSLLADPEFCVVFCNSHAFKLKLFFKLLIM